jgi:hypothetical protein
MKLKYFLIYLLSLTFQLLAMGQTNHGKLGNQQNSYLIIQNLLFYIYQINLWKNLKRYHLVIISLGAFILPLVGQRIKIPGIVLEIAYGITVGPVLGWVDSSEFISGLAILGFLLLMFLSGFEIELDTFREKGLKTLALPMLIYLLTVSNFFLFNFYFGLSNFPCFSFVHNKC